MHPSLTQHQRSNLRFPVIEFAVLLLIVVASSGALFKFGLASLAWAGIYLCVALLCLRDHARLIDAAGLCWPLLLFPLFCLVSVFWSAAPSDTLRHALQYLFTTAIGLWIGTQYDLAQQFRALAIALSACTLVSVAGALSGTLNVYNVGDYVGAQNYFVGLYMQKNVFGVALVFAGLALQVVGAHRQQPLRFAALAALLLPILLLTRSTTALLLYMITWLYLPAVVLARRRASIAATALIGVTFALAASALLIASNSDIVGDALALLGKDATLTGRTVIWQQAAAVALESPLLGIGYQAFWEAARYSNEVMLIRAAVLESIGGFHNGFLEAMVATGVVGVVFYIVLLAGFVAVTVRAALARPEPAQIGAVFMAILVCSRTATESTVYYQHDLEFVLVVALATAAAWQHRAASREIHRD